MKDWTHITAKTPQDKVPQSAGSRLPTISREIILMLFVGVMAVLGLRHRHSRAQWDGVGRIYAYLNELRRRNETRHMHRAMIDDWAGGSPVHWRRQVRAKWLASKAINNSPDPNIRRIGHDAWATKRPYSRVPGIGFARLRSRKNNPHPEAARSAGTRRTRIMGVDPSRRGVAAPQGEGLLVFAPP